jgi:hypothetical protein
MQILMHLCGQKLERARDGSGTYFDLIRIGDQWGRVIKIQRCPTCGELLDDADMQDRAGVPLALEHPSERAIARRAVLDDLATAGYTLHWADGAWHIRYIDQAEDTASATTLDAMIELARAIITGTDPGGDAPMAA